VGTRVGRTRTNVKGVHIIWKESRIKQVGKYRSKLESFQFSVSQSNQNFSNFGSDFPNSFSNLISNFQLLNFYDCPPSGQIGLSNLDSLNQSNTNHNPSVPSIQGPDFESEFFEFYEHFYLGRILIWKRLFDRNLGGHSSPCIISAHVLCSKWVTLRELSWKGDKYAKVGLCHF